MFTGIVQGTAEVLAIEEKPNFAHILSAYRGICYPD